MCFKCCCWFVLYNKPVARGSLGGSEDQPNFQKFTNFVAVIHSLLQLSLNVQRKLQSIAFRMRKNSPTDVQFQTVFWG